MKVLRSLEKILLLKIGPIVRKKKRKRERKKEKENHNCTIIKCVKQRC